MAGPHRMLFNPMGCSSCLQWRGFPPHKWRLGWGLTAAATSPQPLSACGEGLNRRRRDEMEISAPGPLRAPLHDSKASRPIAYL